MKRVLLTGVTTAIGAAVYDELLREPRVSAVLLLLATGEERPATPAAGARGTTVQLAELRADLAAPRFGLTDEAWQRLSGSIDLVLHCSELGELDAPHPEAERANVAPMAGLIELLEARPDTQLAHLSSTLIAGSKRGLFTEFDFDVGQEFGNSYERSKFAAEALLRGSPVWRQVMVFRRSLEYSESGRARSVLDGLVSVLRSRRPALISGDGAAGVDIISAQWVAQAMLQIALLGLTESTFHLVWGSERRVQLGERLRQLVPARVRATWLLAMLPWRVARLATYLSFGVIATLPRGARGLLRYLRERTTNDDYMARRVLSLSRGASVAVPGHQTILAELR